MKEILPNLNLGEIFVIFFPKILAILFRIYAKKNLTFSKNIWHHSMKIQGKKSNYSQNSKISPKILHSNSSTINIISFWRF
jgi:hypothetical protein